MRILIYLLVLLLSSNLLISNTYIDESKALYKNGDYKNSIKKLENCIEDLISLNEKELIGEAYFGLASNYIELDVLDSALKYYLLSEKLLKTSANRKLYSKVLNDLSVCYLRKGLNQNTIHYLRKSIKLNYDLGLNIRLVRNYINLGHASLNLNRLDSAVKYYSIALKLANKDDKKSLNQILNNLGVVFSKSGDYKNAIFYAERVLKNLNSDFLRIDSLFYQTNLDLYLLANKENIKNEFKFDEYSNLAKNLSPQKNADANFKQAIYALYKNDFKKAVSYLNASNSFYTHNGNYSKAIEITKYFNEVVKILGVTSNFETSELLIELKSAEVELYSTELEKELLTLENVEKTIIDLNKEVKFAWLSVEFLSIIIFFLIVMIPISIKYILTRNILHELETTVKYFSKDIGNIHRNDVQNNIAKMANIMLLSNRFSDDDVFVKTIEEIQKGSNKLSLQLNNYNQINRSIYGNTTSTNELQLDE